MPHKPFTIVGLSGGVDSAVAALRLIEAGHKVEGLFMKNWEAEPGEPCPAEQDLADAQAVCDKLKIKLHSVNFSKQYWDNVFTRMLDGYQQGITPNPDVWCNQEIKFKAFLNHALKLGADGIATGHYANKIEKNDSYYLGTAKDQNKDQTYFLHALTQEQLRYATFPLGNLLKSQVRQIAEQAGFVNYNKKDSTGICFIGEQPFKAFLQKYLLNQPGPIVTTDGKVLGQHDGLCYYTIGQRQGLNLGGIKGYPEAPWFVAEKRLETKELVLVQGTDHPLLFTSKLHAIQPHWINDITKSNLTCRAKVRYRQTAEPCTIIPNDHSLEVLFDKPQRAVTPGQYIVFYDNDLCLGGAVIQQTFKH